MSQEDMASDQKSQARAEQRQQAMQELAVKVWLTGGQWWLLGEFVPTDPELMIWLPTSAQEDFRTWNWRIVRDTWSQTL